MFDRLLPSTHAFDPILAALAALVVLLVLWVFILSLRFRSLGKRYRTLFAATAGGELETLLRQYLDTAQEAQRVSLRASDQTERLATLQHGCFQRSGVVRYDAFGDIGGKMSFSLALADGAGNGILLTSVYGREGCRVYAKPLLDGRSDIALSEEEREAVKIALSGGPVSAPV